MIGKAGSIFGGETRVCEEEKQEEKCTPQRGGTICGHHSRRTSGDLTSTLGFDHGMSNLLRSLLSNSISIPNEKTTQVLCGEGWNP